MSLDEAFGLGFMAFDEGRDESDCPCFDTPEEDGQWRDGFREARRNRDSDRERLQTSLCAEDPALKKLMALSPEEIAQRIGMALDDWPGNCFAVACQINRVLDLGFSEHYGHFRGYVSPRSMFASRDRALGWCNHGWLVTGRGVVVDPTRYVFEDEEPRIHLEVEAGNDYDRGGNVFRSKMARKAPPFAPGAPVVVFEDESLREWSVSMLEFSAARAPGAVTRQELFWLCNLPLEVLQPVGQPLLRALEGFGCLGLVPLDNRQAMSESDNHRPQVERQRA